MNIQLHNARSKPINIPAAIAHSGRGPLSVLRRAKTVKEATESQRDELLEDAERIETWAAWAVLLAIVLEATVWVLPLGHRWFKIGNFIADAVVALGIYGEMRFGHVVSDILKIRLGEANERASEARARAARIEQLTAWRRVTLEQQEKLISLLRQRFDIDVLIEFERADPEAYTYAWDIAKIFLNSGSDSAKVRFIGNSWLATGHFGVFMSFSLDDGQSISNGFAEAGIFHTVFGHDLATHLPRGIPTPNLYIFVAPKPPLKTLGDLGDIA